MAVSKPSPIKRPTGYRCRALVTRWVARRNRRAMKPRWCRWCSSFSSSKDPARMCRKTWMIPNSALRFVKPMTIRNVPATSDPTRPRVVCKVEFSSWIGPASAPTPIASRRESPKTTLECPSENQKPTPLADLPSPTSLRAVLSIAAMWSASKAWRTPSRKAVTPRPTPNTPELPRSYCWGTTRPRSTPQPTRFNKNTTQAIAARAVRSRRSEIRDMGAPCCD